MSDFKKYFASSINEYNYLTREETSREFDDFLESNDALAILTGKKGTGKVSFCQFEVKTKFQNPIFYSLKQNFEIKDFVEYILRQDNVPMAHTIENFTFTVTSGGIPSVDIKIGKQVKKYTCDANGLCDLLIECRMAVVFYDFSSLEKIKKALIVDILKTASQKHNVQYHLPKFTLIIDDFNVKDNSFSGINFKKIEFEFGKKEIQKFLEKGSEKLGKKIPPIYLELLAHYFQNNFEGLKNLIKETFQDKSKFTEKEIEKIFLERIKDDPKIREIAGLFSDQNNRDLDIKKLIFNEIFSCFPKSLTQKIISKFCEREKININRVYQILSDLQNSKLIKLKTSPRENGHVFYLNEYYYYFKILEYKMNHTLTVPMQKNIFGIIRSWFVGS
jgi:hypothetical protein